VWDISLLIVGYARASSAAQVAGLEAQMPDALRFSASRSRQLRSNSSPEAALDFVREGDTFKRLAVFACSPMYVSRVNANVILLAMEGNMPENPNPQRLMLTPGVHARLTEVNRLEPEMAALSDDELRRKTDGLKARLRAGTPRVGGQP
jgi:hypothetical protein